MKLAFYNLNNNICAVICRLTAVVALVLLSSCSQGKKGDLSITETVEVAAPADQVWETVGGWLDLHNWHPAVDSTQASGEDKVRILILSGSGARVYEKMTSYDKGSSFSYHMTDPGPLPVQNYDSTVEVESMGDRSKVIWSATFDPADGEKEETATKTMSGVFRAGLDNLVRMFGK